MTFSRAEETSQVDLNSTADKVVLIYDWSMPASEYKALLKAIDKMPGVRSISISQYWLEMCSNFVKLKPNQNDAMQAFWSSFTDAAGSYQSEYPEIFANRHLLFQFERIKQEMATASAYGDVFVALLELLKPSLIIFGHEAFTIERSLVRLARNRKIATASLFHGGLGSKFCYRGLCGDADFIWVWNDIDIECLVHFGVCRYRLKKIGCVRYEYKYTDYIFGCGNGVPTKKGDAKALLGMDNNQPLIALCTAAINTGFASPCADPRKHREAMIGFLKIIESRPDLQFIIKAHPGYDYYQLYREMLDLKLPNLVFNEKITLNEVLDASDLCVMINYCTTAALEAMLNHVPVLFLDNAIYPLPDLQDSLSGTGVRRVATIGELEFAMDELLLNPVARQSALAEADKLLKMFLGIEKNSATDRLLGAIEQVLDSHISNHMHGLTNAKAMREFLYSNSVETIQYRIELANKHDADALMYSLASLSGSYNLGRASLRKIFELFHVTKDSTKADSWNEVRWRLLQTYIEGHDGLGSGKFFSGMGVLISYLTSPKRVLLAPIQFKIKLAKYLINQAVGNKALILTRATYLMLRR